MVQTASQLISGSPELNAPWWVTSESLNMELNHMFGLVWQSTQTKKQTEENASLFCRVHCCNVTKGQTLKPVLLRKVLWLTPSITHKKGRGIVVCYGQTTQCLSLWEFLLTAAEKPSSCPGMIAPCNGWTAGQNQAWRSLTFLKYTSKNLTEYVPNICSLLKIKLQTFTTDEIDTFCTSGSSRARSTVSQTIYTHTHIYTIYTYHWPNTLSGLMSYFPNDLGEGWGGDRPLLFWELD